MTSFAGSDKKSQGKDGDSEMEGLNEYSRKKIGCANLYRTTAEPFCFLLWLRTNTILRFETTTAMEISIRSNKKLEKRRHLHAQIRNCVGLAPLSLAGLELQHLRRYSLKRRRLKIYGSVQKDFSTIYKTISSNVDSFQIFASQAANSCSFGSSSEQAYYSRIIFMMTTL